MLMDTTNIFAHFWKLREEVNISSSQADLYYYLIHKSISFGRKITFQLSNKFICLHLGMSEKTLIACRNGLKQAGLITFSSGKQNKTRSTYELLYWKNYSTEGGTGYSTQGSTYDSTSDSTEGKNTPDKIYYNNNLNSNKQTNLNKKGKSSNEAPPENLNPESFLEPGPDEEAIRGKATHTGAGAKVIPLGLVYPYESENFQQAWQNWLNHRKAIKKPYKTLEAQQALLKQLSNFDELYAIGLIERAISNEYQGVVFPNSQSEYQKQLKFNNHAGINQTGNRLDVEEAVSIARMLASQ